MSIAESKAQELLVLKAALKKQQEFLPKYISPYRSVPIRYIRQKSYDRALLHRGEPWADQIIKAWKTIERKKGKRKERARENIKTRTPAELRFEEILKGLNIQYIKEYQVIFKDTYYFLDFKIKGFDLAFEIDGSAHDNRGGYDLDRDLRIYRARRIKIVRFNNYQVLNESRYVIELIVNIINKLEQKDP